MVVSEKERQRHTQKRKTQKMVVVRHSPKPAPFVVVVVVVASLLLAASGGTADALAPLPPTSASSPSRALAAADTVAARRRPADGIVDIDVDGDGDGDVDCDGGVRSSSRHGGGRRGRRQQMSRRGLVSSAAAVAAASSSLLLPPMAPPAFAASDDSDGTTTETAPPMRPPPTVPYTRLPSPGDKFQFGYSITPPPTFVPSNKPLRTHLDEINFSPPPSDARGYTIGVTIDPVRINSMREFGSPGEVAARVVTAEVNRDGVFEVTLAKDPKEDDTTGGYDIEYVTDGKRGTKRFVTRVYVKDGYLYVLTVQSREKDYDGAREAEVSECVGSFRPL